MVERFPGVVWWCDKCGANLSEQYGFDDYNTTWQCSECGYVNAISENNIFDSHEDFYSHRDQYGVVELPNKSGISQESLDQLSKVLSQGMSLAIAFYLDRAKKKRLKEYEEKKKSLLGGDDDMDPEGYSEWNPDRDLFEFPPDLPANEYARICRMVASRFREISSTVVDGPLVVCEVRQRHRNPWKFNFELCNNGKSLWETQNDESDIPSRFIHMMFDEIYNFQVEYSKDWHEAECPNCGQTMLQKKRIDDWECLTCGCKLPPYVMEADSGYIYWYCDGCRAFLNMQEGFTTENKRWVCTKCGFDNNVDESDPTNFRDDIPDRSFVLNSILEDRPNSADGGNTTSKLTSSTSPKNNEYEILPTNYCSRCGKKNPYPNGKFCWACGTKFPKARIVFD